LLFAHLFLLLNFNSVYAAPVADGANDLVVDLGYAKYQGIAEPATG
jgi:hypothetical protein